MQPPGLGASFKQATFTLCTTTIVGQLGSVMVEVLISSEGICVGI